MANSDTEIKLCNRDFPGLIENASHFFITAERSNTTIIVASWDSPRFQQLLDYLKLDWFNQFMEILVLYTFQMFCIKNIAICWIFLAILRWLRTPGTQFCYPLEILYLVSWEILQQFVIYLKNYPALHIKHMLAHLQWGCLLLAILKYEMLNLPEESDHTLITIYSTCNYVSCQPWLQYSSSP